MADMSEKTDASTAVVLSFSALFWALSFVGIKIALEAYSPVAVVSIRLFFVSLILGGVFLLRFGLKGLPQKKDLPLFILIGALNPFLAFFLESESLLFISASLASVIASTAPLMIPLVAFFLLKDRVNIFNILGLVLSFIGVCIIILGPGADTEYTLGGLLMMFASVLACVFYAVFAKKLLKTYPALVVVVFQQIFGFLFYVPLFLIREAGTVFSPGTFSLKSFISILFLAVFSSSMAYYLYNLGIKRIGPSRASAFLNLIPVIAAVAAFFILREPLGITKMAGIAVAICGLFLSQRRTKTYPAVLPPG